MGEVCSTVFVLLPYSGTKAHSAASKFVVLQFLTLRVIFLLVQSKTSAGNLDSPQHKPVLHPKLGRYRKCNCTWLSD